MGKRTNKRIDEEIWDEAKDRIPKTNLLKLGPYYNYMINSDIKHLAFTLSRYKFVSKLLLYRENISLLELGCQEAIGALLFKQNNKLNKYVGIDLDEEAIKWNREHLPNDFEFICENFFECKMLERRGEHFDSIVSLDVIEHISVEMEDEYCKIISANLKQDGVAVVGTPSVMLSPYASEGSKIGHVNLYDQERLYKLMNKYFHNVFIFNMNDEIVNMGFAPMSCYIFALCCNIKC